MPEKTVRRRQISKRPGPAAPPEWLTVLEGESDADAERRLRPLLRRLLDDGLLEALSGWIHAADDEPHGAVLFRAFSRECLSTSRTHRGTQYGGRLVAVPLVMRGRQGVSFPNSIDLATGAAIQEEIHRRFRAAGLPKSFCVPFDVLLHARELQRMYPEHLHTALHRIFDMSAGPRRMDPPRLAFINPRVAPATDPEASEVGTRLVSFRLFMMIVFSERPADAEAALRGAEMLAAIASRVRMCAPREAEGGDPATDFMVTALEPGYPPDAEAAARMSITRAHILDFAARLSPRGADAATSAEGGRAVVHFSPGRGTVTITLGDGAEMSFMSAQIGGGAFAYRYVGLIAADLRGIGFAAVELKTDDALGHSPLWPGSDRPVVVH